MGQLELIDGTIEYECIEDGVKIIGYKGTNRSLIIPVYIEEAPVLMVEKKAFMGNRFLREIEFPEHIEELGQWALASCPFLERVILPKKELKVQIDAFVHDAQLKEIILRQDGEELPQDFSYMLAKVPQMLHGEYFFNMKEVGEPQWIRQWDESVLKMLQEPDEHGHTNMILCGEEDVNCNLDAYIMQRRKEKAGYAYLRLIHGLGMAREVKEQLEQYLRSHAKGQEGEAAWRLLKEEYGHLPAYYTCYVQAGCLSQENYQETLEDLGQLHPEMKAYFIRWNREHTKTEDAFSMFDL